MRLSDNGHHYIAHPVRVARPASEDELRAVLAEAGAHNLRVSVMGAAKSQGGLILCDGLIVSTARLNRVLEVAAARMTARLQPGVTWDQLRAALAAHGLATLATQSYGVFTIGGSVAVNAHGRNVEVGALASTIEALRVMAADGTVRTASRMENAELFSLVIGGFGLFGIVTEITLRLTANTHYQRACVAAMPAAEYPRYFAQRIRADAAMHFHYARFDVDAGRAWQRLFCVDYRQMPAETEAKPETAAAPARAHTGPAAAPQTAHALAPAPRHESVRFERFTLWCFRKFNWARRLRFGGDVLYRIKFDVSARNRVAQESWAAIARTSRRSVDWLQEFFVPVARFMDFVARAQVIFAHENWVPLNTTVRYLPRSSEAFLSYAREECFSFVLFFEQRHNPAALEQTERVLRRLLDAALDCGGTFYLCYQRIATPAQLRRAYPRIDEFFALKRRYDPDERFYNQFYGHYAGGEMSQQPMQPRSTQPHVPRRALRLPAVERHAIVAADGTELLLQRYNGGPRGPVLCAAGYAMASGTFLLDTIDTNLAEYLCERGHDVWLFSWRSSPEVMARLRRPARRFTLDDVAHYDWPAAVAHVCRTAGAERVDCVVHCIGAQTLLMAAAAGLLDGRVNSIVSLQAGLHYATTPLTRFKARLRLAEVLDFIGLRAIAASAHTRGGLYRVLDLLLRLHPISRSERCGHATCRRAAFLWGELLRHANVDEATHARMPDLLGDAAILPFVQMTSAIRSGRIRDRNGNDVYVANAARGLRLPLTFIHGSRNDTLRAPSTERTFNLLVQQNGPALYRRVVVDGYGHLDCLIGRTAPADVFPLIGAHLQWVEERLEQGGTKPARAAA
jgi:FAD/FMN-containing dehydrogenase